MEPIIIEPPTGKPAESVVIWLHGLGADGHDFEGIVPQLGLDLPIRFIFPTAPEQAVTVNMNLVSTAWYDIRSMDLMAQVDWPGIQQSLSGVYSLIEAEMAKGIASEKILVAGFSQGGLIALYAGLTFPQKIAGIMALSTYFPLSGWGVQQSKSLPIFYGHGLYDPICPLATAEKSLQNLQTLGFKPNWRTYPMQHQVCDAEIDDMAGFIEQCLGGAS